MKKILMGTSAIAMAGAYAGDAEAAKWDLDWGGYFEASVGFASVDATPGLNNNGRAASSDFDGVDVMQDGEIQFTPSITLDNGLTFGVDVQLEANAGTNGTGDVIDESFAFVKGSFGQVLIGSENSAGYKMTYGAPDVTWVNVNSGSLGNFIPFSGGGLGGDVFRGTLGSSYVEVDRNNDSQRITYFSPRFAGFQVGASYARDGNQDNSSAVDVNVPGTLHDIFDVGANYVNSFGAFDVALSGRWGTGTIEGPGGGDPTVWAAGLNLGYAGVTIGGSFSSMDGDGVSRRDGQFYDAGISYETGPWGFSVTYAHGEDINNDAGAPLTADEELTQIVGGVNYNLGPGVTAGIYAGYVDFSEDGYIATGAGANPFGTAVQGDEIDGFVVGTGFKLSF